MTMIMKLDMLEVDAAFAESEIGLFVMKGSQFSLTESIWRGAESGGLHTEMLGLMRTLNLKVSKHGECVRRYDHPG